ncbi:hypothetical protein [Aurantivibrio plasticivorans]
MRLVIDTRNGYSADFLCDNARDGQRILNERAISVLYITQKLHGRGTGLDVLRWAQRRNRLPVHVVVTAKDRGHQATLTEFLTSAGYVGNGTFYHKARTMPR